MRRRAPLECRRGRSRPTQRPDGSRRSPPAHLHMGWNGAEIGADAPLGERQRVVGMPEAASVVRDAEVKLAALRARATLGPPAETASSRTRALSGQAPSSHIAPSPTSTAVLGCFPTSFHDVRQAIAWTRERRRAPPRAEPVCGEGSGTSSNPFSASGVPMAEQEPGQLTPYTRETLLMSLNVVARRRGAEGPRSGTVSFDTQSECGDTADRIAPHQPAIRRAARVLHERSHIGWLRRIDRVGLPLAESVCRRCGIGQHGCMRYALETEDATW